MLIDNYIIQLVISNKIQANFVIKLTTPVNLSNSTSCKIWISAAAREAANW
jgi:pantothenate kinase